MSEEKKKKNKIIGISIGIFIVLLIVISSTYAFWQITKKQADTNRVNTKCLSFEMEGGPGISIPKAMPTSDEDGLKLEGYTFTVTNNCPDDVDYLIGLEALEDTSNPNYIDAQYIKISLDNGMSKRIGSLSTIDNTIHENDTETIINTRKIATATLKGNGVNTHVLKMWLSSDAPITEQNKSFKSRVIITGGQGIENATLDKCFTIDENGEILGYNYTDSECKEDVVIPSKINDIKVKTIDTNAFRGTKTKYNYVYYVVLDSSYTPLYVALLDSSKEQDLLAWAEANGYSTLPYYKNGEQPELESGQHVQYCTFDNSNNPSCGDLDSVPSNITTTSSSIIITGLDLSKAEYLETIEASAFSNVPANVNDLSTYSNYDTSLTSLKFGKNTNSIKFEHNAFARINVDDLTTYASYYTGLDANDDVLTPLGGAIINNLSIKSTSKYNKLEAEFGTIESTMTIIKAPIYNGISANNLTINEGITNWDSYVFIDSVLGTVNLPNSMDFSGSHAFGLVSSIDKLVLPSELTIVPVNAFSDIRVNAVDLPDTLERVEKGAFSGTPITTITLPDSLTFIGESAFNSTHLSSVTIPKSVTTIEASAFYSYSNYPLNTIIFKGRSDTSDITLGASYINPDITTVQFEP